MEYLARHAPDEVTEDMNAALDRVGQPAAPDPFSARAASRALRGCPSMNSIASRQPRAPDRRMVDVQQGDVWWADLPDPVGSGPGFRRPVVIVQGDSLNRSRIATVVCVPLTSNLVWADAPGNVRLTARSTGLPKESVANVSLIVALDRTLLSERSGRLAAKPLTQILHGIDVVLGR